MCCECVCACSYELGKLIRFICYFFTLKLKPQVYENNHMRTNIERINFYVGNSMLKVLSYQDHSESKAWFDIHSH